ncbi:PGF-pre-PGF domain-containing protein [Natronomonas gomsonensis]|uniref:PGF-pre-PGF domain-containing protein n=1 Tax=Natronomonas gomsonensis TaxID=1046043 RepID=UPI0020CA4E98|nr:PGF-pre-PGF domain-containing protein [Natronomonas gomsonensis]MCY4730341.1 PGF-pre-PGF domain-containing protein [Natronomonas gomsonensis]
MRTESITAERVRSLLLVAVMICALVGGSVAVAGSATADFDTSSEFTTDDTSSDGTDSTENTTESAETTENESRTHTGEATAGPDSVGVTAGADEQPAIATPDAGPATLRFTEDEANGFPADGTATLALPEDGGVTFDTEASSVSVTATNATVSETTLSERKLSIAVDTDDGVESEIAVDGLRFVATSDAAAVEATWSFGDATGATTVQPERMTAAGFGSVVPRGVDGGPDGGTGFSLQPDPQNARTNGFHERGEFVGVFIDEAYADRLTFDRSSVDDLEIRTSSQCRRDNFAETTGTRNAYVQGNVLFFRVYCQLDHDDYLTVQNVRFNTTGATADESPDFDAALDVKYDPVNNTDSTRVTADGDDRLSVRSPTVEGATTSVERGTNATTGDQPVSVTVADEHGGLVADGSQLTVSLTGGDGVSFNDSQSVEVVSESDSFTATVADVTPDSLVLDVDGDSSAGDSLTIQGANESGLTFDVGENASDANLTATTNAGGDDVTQSAGSVSVGGSDSGTDEGDEGEDEDSSGDDGGGEDGIGDGDDGDSDGDGEDGENDDGEDGEEDSSNDSDDNTGDGTDDGTENADDDSGPSGGSGDSPPSSGGGGGGGGGGGAPADDSTDDSTADDNAAATATQPIEDAAPDQPGTTVEFDIGMLDSITFAEGASGNVTVTVHEELPEGVPATPGTMIRAMSIDVPEELENESATITMSADADSLDADPERVALDHYDDGDGEWDTLETTVSESESGESTFEATTPGFSLFAVQTTQPTPTPTTSGTEGTATPADTETETPTPTAAPSGDDAGGDGPLNEAAGFTQSMGTSVLLGTAIAALLLVVSGIRLYRRNDSL